MTTTAPTFDEIVEGLRSANVALDAEGQRHALTLLRAVAEGEPVSPAVLAERTGQRVDEATAFIEGLPGVYRDGDGNVTGFWGLANAEMPPHRYRVAGRDLFAWCAWDPFILTDWLGGSAVVTSVDARTGEPVSLRIEDGEALDRSHPDLVLSFRHVRQWDHDVIASFCHFVHFFVDRRSAEAWTVERPGTFVLSLGEGIELGRIWGQLVFPDLDPGS